MSEFEDQKVAGDEEQEEDTSLANSDVTTKYQEAAKIVNAALTEIIALVMPKRGRRFLTNYHFNVVCSWRKHC